MRVKRESLSQELVQGFEAKATADPVRIKCEHKQNILNMHTRFRLFSCN